MVVLGSLPVPGLEFEESRALLLGTTTSNVCQSVRFQDSPRQLRGVDSDPKDVPRIGEGGSAEQGFGACQRRFLVSSFPAIVILNEITAHETRFNLHSTSSLNQL